MSCVLAIQLVPLGVCPAQPEVTSPRLLVFSRDKISSFKERILLRVGISGLSFFLEGGWGVEGCPHLDSQRGHAQQKPSWVTWAQWASPEGSQAPQRREPQESVGPRDSTSHLEITDQDADLGEVTSLHSPFLPSLVQVPRKSL